MTVLICAHRHSAMAGALLDSGCVPLVRERIDEALDTLRHEQIGGVLVDAASADVDALEFVLNVRDIDSAVPILVTASEETLRDLGSTLAKLSSVHLAEAGASPEQTVCQLERIARAGEWHS